MATFFVSYVYEDKAFRQQIEDWHRQGQLGHWKPVFESADLRPEGWNAIKRHLSPLIRSSEVLVCLVGENSHNRYAIDYEIQDARSAGIPIIKMRIPNTYGGAPPTVRGDEVEYRPASLAAALDAAVYDD
jgi:hypothetical protein